MVTIFSIEERSGSQKKTQSFFYSLVIFCLFFFVFLQTTPLIAPPSTAPSLLLVWRHQTEAGQSHSVVLCSLFIKATLRITDRSDHSSLGSLGSSEEQEREVRGGGGVAVALLTIWRADRGFDFSTACCVTWITWNKRRKKKFLFALLLNGE